MLLLLLLIGQASHTMSYEGLSGAIMGLAGVVQLGLEQRVLVQLVLLVLLFLVVLLHLCSAVLEPILGGLLATTDRKSTRLNSSHWE